MLNKAQKLIKFFKDYNLNPEEFCVVAKAPKLGYFHFKDGSYYPKISDNPASNVDGIYVADGYCLTAHQLKEKVYRSQAESFCKEMKCVLPPWNVYCKFIDKSNREKLNNAIQKLGWPQIIKRYSGRPNYWFDGISEADPYPAICEEEIDFNAMMSVHKNRVRGFIYTGNHVFEPTEEDVKSILDDPWQMLIKLKSKYVVGIFEYFFEERMKVPRPGNFHIDNNRFVSDIETLNGPENDLERSLKGIYVNCNTYLNLKTPVEAVEIDQIRHCKLPSENELAAIVDKIPIIDNALSAIGRDDFRLMDGNTLCRHSWTTEKRTRSENRNCPGEHYRLLLLEKNEKFKPEQEILWELENILLD